MTSESAATLFDSIGASYEAAWSSSPGQAKSLQWLLDNLPPSSKVVDIGCGTGKPACSALAAAGFSVTGIDVSPVMLETARSQVPSAHFELASGLTWEPKEGDGSLDAVVVYHSLIANITQDEIRGFFGRAWRWVRAGGLFVFATVPIEGNLKKLKWLGRDLVSSGLSAEENVECIRKAGFEVEEDWMEMFMPKAVESGLCKEGEEDEEPHLFVLARKPT
ncbi:hypothetical protein CLAFUW4_09951 [Fulvia fulva]|uniref:Methyltransferase domain-containing protein n=1 Tax=Passalora fulva TaxID=5499 RepID=A0A9Q8PIP5_PASFU|nr:uncharacterized protein CLAFUR5_12292 [Fulvia fulva]KAK4615527.1 hypothetical protein CLAFUR4_09955 [Fulvia fulva]KAK4616677.1 hypothetical protein CLAFUR0_09952 [Fulvia fulva]UJO23105.1 hypothetical protein CLAFUR5_12292 [Fulvia fulva]WPV19576.1 hypothetical protein CLAFUW4_09951 [Fulvia fulva]WPV34384.1 hypothetical protein CLAFUW7_09952 [Fulvia fulva]